MCLYPKLIPNPKYKPNRKNNYNPPKVKDRRTLLIPVGCQKCMECMKQRARGWQIRLMEEIQKHKKEQKHFITLTLNKESLTELQHAVITEAIHAEEPAPEGYEMDNAIATLAVRRFTERWRAKYGTTIRHWLITELGHGTTEHIHLHGIIFAQTTEKQWSKNQQRLITVDTTQQRIAELWKYGYIWKGTYVNEATVNYTIKYAMKQDLDHKHYKPKILTSKGIGNNYTNSHNARLNKYQPGGQTREEYKLRDGRKMAMPAYYRNKIYTEEQREKLWIEKIDKQERWVNGSRVSIANGDKDYYLTLQEARLKNQRLGYGDDTENWTREKYEHQRRELIHATRTTRDTPNMETPKHSRLDRPRKGQIDTQFKRITEWLHKVDKGQKTYPELPE